MEPQVEDSDVRVRLQVLWKGTLFVGIASSYALIVALLLIFHGWRPALLGLFLIVVSQFFRYIANDVDRIGWNLSKRPTGETISESTRRYQRRMLYLLVGLAQVQNLALLCQAYYLSGFQWMLAMLVGLGLIEFFYYRIRAVNRRVEFEQASYGFRDSGVFSDGPDSISPSDKAREDKLERKLQRLKEMVDSGEISERAYEKARDKHRVKSVMDDAQSRRRK